MEDPAERRAKKDTFRPEHALLPLSEKQERNLSNGHAIQPVPGLNEKFAFPGGHFKRDDNVGGHEQAATPWLPPGTKQETTWEPGDKAGPSS